MAVFPEQHRDDGERDQRKDDEQRDLPLRRRFGEEAESGPGIFGVDDAKKTGDDGDAVVHGQLVLDQPFCVAVEGDDESGDEEEIFAHRL